MRTVRTGQREGKRKELVARTQRQTKHCDVGELHRTIQGINQRNIFTKPSCHTMFLQGSTHVLKQTSSSMRACLTLSWPLTPSVNDVIITL